MDFLLLMVESKIKWQDPNIPTAQDCKLNTKDLFSSSKRPNSDVTELKSSSYRSCATFQNNFFKVFVKIRDFTTKLAENTSNWGSIKPGTQTITASIEKQRPEITHLIMDRRGGFGADFGEEERRPS